MVPSEQSCYDGLFVSSGIGDFTGFALTRGAGFVFVGERHCGTARPLF